MGGGGSVWSAKGGSDDWARREGKGYARAKCTKPLSFVNVRNDVMEMSNSSD